METEDEETAWWSCGDRAAPPPRTHATGTAGAYPMMGGGPRSELAQPELVDRGGMLVVALAAVLSFLGVVGWNVGVVTAVGGLVALFAGPATAMVALGVDRRPAWVLLGVATLAVVVDWIVLG